MDEENKFTPYAIIPTPTQTFGEQVGPLYASGYANPKENKLGGRLEYTSGDLVLGANKALNESGMLDFSTENLKGTLDKAGYDVSASTGELNTEVGYSSRAKTPYVNYKGNNLSVNATSSDIKTGVTVDNFTANSIYARGQNPYFDAKVDLGPASLGGSYSKDMGYSTNANVKVGGLNLGVDYNQYGGPALNANYQQLFKNGVIDANGQLTPEGYNLMLQGTINF